MNEHLIFDIAEIINAIHPNTIFDAHFVIQQLHALYHNDYEECRAHYRQPNTFHSAISREIRRIAVEREFHDEGIIVSPNINGTPTPNRAWERI